MFTSIFPIRWDFFVRHLHCIVPNHLFPSTHRCSTNNYRTHKWILMTLRKEMTCWGCKALPTWASRIHGAPEPVDSKTLGVSVSRLSPWVSAPATGKAMSLAVDSAQVDSRYWACLGPDRAKGDLAQARAGLAEDRARERGPGGSRRAAALPLPEDAQSRPPESPRLATTGPRGCVGWRSCLISGSPRQRFKHKRFIWEVL